MAKFRVLIVFASVLSFVGPISTSDAQEADSPVQQLGHSDMSHRLHAINQLMNLGESVIPELIEALGYKNQMVRVNAVYVLGRMGLPAKSAIPALTKVLIDDSPLVRESAAEALRKIGTPEAMKALGAYEKMQKPATNRSKWVAFGMGSGSGVLLGGLIGAGIGSGARCLDEDGVEGDCIIEGMLIGAIVGAISGGIIGQRLLGGSSPKNAIQRGRIRNHENLFPNLAKSDRIFYTQFFEIQF